ncbi:hypothetical protein [Bacillus marinisedimentorum]|uniref:hypothetical protein n=1 Tax=Bacillus marinisedimentorum TaxID=1821260 RepID=UPI0007E2A4C2|nr:hypothetical protein [Bacillus marinisedimentorum]
MKRKQLMIQGPTVVLKRKHDRISGRVDRVAVFGRFQIAEVAAKDHSVFYLVMYRGKLVGGGEAEAVKLDSFIARAYRSGIILSGANTLAGRLFNKGEYVVPDVKHILTKLQSHFSLYEISAIARSLDTFFSTEELISIFKKLYFHFKRQGQDLHSFQVSLFAREAAPHSEWVKRIFSSMEFKRYENEYRKPPQELLSKDPLYFEELLFSSRRHDESFRLLQSYYRQQSKDAEETVLLFDRLVFQPEQDNWKRFETLLPGFAPDTADKCRVLEELVSNMQKPFPPISNELLKMAIETKRVNLALSQYIELHDSLSKPPAELYSLFDLFDPSTAPELLHQISTLLSDPVFQQSAAIEPFVRKAVISLLQHKSIAEVIDWLKPAEKSPAGAKIFRELKQAEALSEDADRQMELGRFYFDYRLYEQAEGCFSWEMELSPDNPEPALWLGKVCQAKGLADEAQSYMDLSAELARQR